MAPDCYTFPMSDTENEEFDTEEVEDEWWFDDRGWDERNDR